MIGVATFSNNFDDWQQEYEEAFKAWTGQSCKVIRRGSWYGIQTQSASNPRLFFGPHRFWRKIDILDMTQELKRRHAACLAEMREKGTAV